VATDNQHKYTQNNTYIDAQLTVEDPIERNDMVSAIESQCPNASVTTSGDIVHILDGKH
jgi:hypothetical protein